MNCKGAVTEVAIYRVKRSQLVVFSIIYSEVRNDVSGYPGFIGLSNQRRVTNNQVFVDIYQWESKELAFAAMSRFRQSPVADRFRSYFDGNAIFLGHFDGDTGYGVQG